LKAHGQRHLLFAAWMCVAPLAAPAAQERPGPQALQMTAAERDAFLMNASVVDAGPQAAADRPRRVSLDDGRRTHAASLVVSPPPDASPHGYRLNVAAYELDKLLALGLVVPSVERVVNGRPVILTWWADDVVMAEHDRRQRQLEPPDRVSWDDQMQAVRVFDELTANAYRSMNPEKYSSTLWDNLLVTAQWRMVLVDHTRAFQTTRQLEYPNTLIRCDRAMLATLRALDRDRFGRGLGALLTTEQLDALEARRLIIVRHFDQRIARQGQRAVLYDLPPRR